jgi:beta-galactosidase
VRIVSGLSRRDLLKAGGAGVAGLAVLGMGSGAAARPSGPAARIVPLTSDWWFGRPDDSGFERVTLPHCVADLSWRDWEPADWEDVFVYRRRLDLPRELRGLRVFLDFAGSLTGTTPTVNGTELSQHLGGYLPFSYELTDLLTGRDNLLAVAVDGRWLDVPPSGAPAGARAVDYLQPAGLYREVSLRGVPPVFLADVFARPVDPLAADRRVEVECTVDGAQPFEGRIELALLDGRRELAHASVPVALAEPGRATVRATLERLGDVRLWDVDDPQLYTVRARLVGRGRPVHDHTVRIGFREARFELDGFFLNGRRLKLFGLNRHQLYPYVGMAMPARAQRRDAELLKRELNCNVVRCSHYPQSEHFLDACDELGLLVFEEIPGWQYLGGPAWRELAVRDVETMIRRGRNRPSIVTWGVRINESANARELYARTEALAKELDPSRHTTGAMVGGIYSTNDFQHDVFSYNDYLHTAEAATLRPPLPGIPYVVTEAIGSLAGPNYYRRTDSFAVQQRQAELHAQVHNQAGSDDRYGGLIAWSGIDYQSMTGFVDRRMKRNGIMDTFRVPKPGAALYMAQVDPRERPVIEPAFYWDFGPKSPPDGPGPTALIGSNCDRLEIYVGGEHRASVLPALADYPYLRYPPFVVDLAVDGAGLPELRVDGYVDGRRVLTRHFASDPAGDRLAVSADDDRLVADGSDVTRVVFRAVDRFGAARPYPTGDVTLTLDGPGELVGDSPFAFEEAGGVGAVWVRALPGRSGRVTLRATHPALGSATAYVYVHRGGT